MTSFRFLCDSRCVLMPSVTKCDVNGHDSERKDIQLRLTSCGKENIILRPRCGAISGPLEFRTNHWGQMRVYVFQTLNSHFDDLLPRCSLSMVSLDHSTLFSVFLFLSLMVRLRPSCDMTRRSGLPDTRHFITSKLKATYWCFDIASPCSHPCAEIHQSQLSVVPLEAFITC